MKKRTLAGIVLAMSAVLAGCGQSGSESGTTKAEATTAAATTEAAAKETEEKDAGAETEVAKGEAEGYGGTITAEVTLEGDKIVDLKLTGDSETPTVGGTAMETLKAAILEKGSLDGVDAVAGATWTSNGVFKAVKSAMGMETEEEKDQEQKELAATGLSHGIGFSPSGRNLENDDKDTGIYCINDVIAYVLFDDDGRILDLEVDQLELSTPNYDGEHMPHLTGFPGQSYNADADHDEKVDKVLSQTVDTFHGRDRGLGYQERAGKHL